MKVIKFNKMWGGVIFISLFLNLALLALLFVSEYKGRTFSQAIERRGFITIESQSLPDYWALYGWTNTLNKLRIEADIAFFGNSITADSDFQSEFPDKKIVNLGYPGDNIKGMLRRIPMLSAVNPKKIFIMAGTNDLVHVSLEEYTSRYKCLIKAIKDSNPQSSIYIESVLPSNHKLSDYAPNKKIQQANAILHDIANTFDCTFIDLYNLYVDNDNELIIDLTKDGVHLLPESYKIWSESIKNYIYE